MMELDEMKSVWVALDDRLKKSEILEARIIREMKQTKANKSLSRLLNFEIFSLILILIFLPLVLFSLNRFITDLTVRILQVYSIIYLLACTVWYIYKLLGLMKINLSNKITDNIYLINHYNIQIKREKIWGTITASPIFVLITAYYAQIKVPMNLWIFMSCMFFVAIILTIWIYKKLYDSNIQSVKNSLEELKELEEE